jgi:hypothetical protein
MQSSSTATPTSTGITDNDDATTTTTTTKSAVGAEQRASRTSSMASSSSRFETFTEAVPLSLSSMAHQGGMVPLNDGVLDGCIQVVQHTLLQCVNYARIVYAPHLWSFADIATTPYAWTPLKLEESPPPQQQQQAPLIHRNESTTTAIPHSLQRMNFVHQYSRNAWICLKSKLPTFTEQVEQSSWRDHSNDWNVTQPDVLGRISLMYTSTEPLTPGELSGNETDDMPPCILYKVVVEYRSLPSTGKQHAVQAEELSMLSFGGSIDDDVKYGALASLYDEQAKYVLEIFSVRGKKYKFDLMDSTLSNGLVPRLPIRDSGTSDPFVKSLCVTVTDHHYSESESAVIASQPQVPPIDEENVAMTCHNNNKQCAVTRMYLTMEGRLRATTNKSGSNDDPLHDLPAFDYMKNALSYAFLRLNPTPPDMVQASPSGHTLLLDPDVAGHIYVNGRYAMTWGEDPGSASHGLALFGMDLHSVPFWNGRIVDFELVKEIYAQLWHEILVDARLQPFNIASKLLHRLMKGSDANDNDDDNDLYDTDLDEGIINPDIHQDCLESLVLASPNYDRVGIAAKALATRFAIEFGKNAFPCLGHETEWVKRSLPDRETVVVPQRLINILRRGGYFDAQKTSDLLWFTESRRMNEGYESDVVTIAVQYLEEAGCTDVDSDNIVVVSTLVADNVIAKDAVCRWDPNSEQFFVHEDFFKSSMNEFIGNNTSDTTPERIKGYLLGMYIAKAHPVGFGKIFARYLVRNKL